jgi:hypothetical protein
MDVFRFESLFLQGLALPERSVYLELRRVLYDLESRTFHVTPIIAHGREFDQDALDFRIRDYLDYLVYEPRVWYKHPLVRAYVKSRFNGRPHTDIVLAKNDDVFPDLARMIDAVLEVARLHLPHHTFAVKEVQYDLDKRVHGFSLGDDEKKGSDFRSEILI